LPPNQTARARVSTRLAANQYLDPISVVPTYHFQPSLPRLPIPKLEETLPKVGGRAATVPREASCC